MAMAMRRRDTVGPFPKAIRCHDKEGPHDHLHDKNEDNNHHDDDDDDDDDEDDDTESHNDNHKETD
ncbi:hypothetical protein BGW38_004677, partial [Lunasporangiospora selenospora]